MMARDPVTVMKSLEEIEAVAEEILTDKQHIVEVDHKRNKNREAIRSLTNQLKETNCETKSWVTFGNMFVKLPSQTAKEFLEKDQLQLDKEEERLRMSVKSNVYKLRKLEGKPELQGFLLNALNKDEMKAVNVLLSPKTY